MAPQENKEDKVHVESGHILKGDRIAACAMKIRRIHVIHGIATHGRQTFRLERDAFCIIERPFEFVMKRQQKKSK